MYINTSSCINCNANMKNGILIQANDAKTRTEEVEEKLKLEAMGSYGEDGKIDINKLNENLKNLGIENAVITKLPAKIEM